MASRKDLKKNISAIVSELIGECIIRSQFVPGTDEQAAGEIVGKLIELDADFTSRVSHTEPGNVKAYYRALYKDFNEQIEGICNEIEALSPKQA